MEDTILVAIIIAESEFILAVMLLAAFAWIQNFRQVNYETSKLLIVIILSRMTNELILAPFIVSFSFTQKLP